MRCERVSGGDNSGTATAADSERKPNLLQVVTSFAAWRKQAVAHPFMLLDLQKNQA